MAGGLRKLPGDGVWGDGYRVSGTLEGITGPGRRTVRRLEVRHLEPRSSLAALRAFPDLEWLWLEWADDVDLSPLENLELRSLELRHVTGVDLDPLQRVCGLKDLVLIDVSRARVPAGLRLPESLEALSIIDDEPGTAAQAVGEVVEAIDWHGLPRLHTLNIRAGGTGPAYVDLGFLTALPRLTRLDLYRGVWHRGPQPSPLEPPFSGLPRGLEWMRIDAWEPATVREQLQEYFGLPVDPIGSVPVVFQRHVYRDDGGAAWDIIELEGDPPRWAADGSFWKAAKGRDGETEAEALAVAKRRIRAVDPPLLRRLEFDQESDNTGIIAARREDLETTLEILGLTRR